MWPVSISLRMALLRRQEIQPSPGCSFKCSIWVCVSMPRLPASTTRFRPNCSRSLSTWSGTVLGSALLPG